MALFAADDPVGGKDAAAQRPRQQQPGGDAHVAEEVRPDVRGEVAVVFFSKGGKGRVGKRERERERERARERAREKGKTVSKKREKEKT